MALKKSEKRLLIIAGIVVVAFLIDKVVLKKDTQKKPAKKSQTVAVAGNGTAAVSGGGMMHQAPRAGKTIYDGWGKDPFRVQKKVKVVIPSAASLAAARPPKPVIPEATLHGIFWKEGKPYVLINNDVMSEGEMKNGIRVDRIENHQVLCNYAGQSFTLYWRETL